MSMISTFVRRAIGTCGAMIAGAGAGALLFRSFEQMEARLSDTQKVEQLKSMVAWLQKLAERKHEPPPMCQAENCTHHGYGYMLKDDVWKQAQRGDDKIHYLCLFCVSARLGRRLSMSDFTDTPINTPVRQAAIMIDFRSNPSRVSSHIPPDARWYNGR